jgi:hypothetical protein
MSTNIDANTYYNSEQTILQNLTEQAGLLSSSQHRHSLLNDSYRKRFSKYVQILMVLVLAFITYLGITMIQRSFTFIPTLVFDMIIIVLIVAVALYVVYTGSTLFIRDNTNFDEIDAQPLEDGSGVDVKALLEAGKLSPDTLVNGKICVGQECCPTGFTWDASNNKCITNAPQPFTTLNSSQVSFDDPTLQRSPNSGIIIPSYFDTNLQFSTV